MIRWDFVSNSSSCNYTIPVCSSIHISNEDRNRAMSLYNFACGFQNALNECIAEINKPFDNISNYIKSLPPIV